MNWEWKMQQDACAKTSRENGRNGRGNKIKYTDKWHTSGRKTEKNARQESKNGKTMLTWRQHSTKKCSWNIRTAKWWHMKQSEWGNTQKQNDDTKKCSWKIFAIEMHANIVLCMCTVQIAIDEFLSAISACFFFICISKAAVLFCHLLALFSLCPSSNTLFSLLCFGFV